MNGPRYDHALAASLVIMDEMDARPGMARHELLALMIFSFLHALDAMEEERAPLVPSMN